MKRQRTAWLFVAPATLHLLVFALIPIFASLYLSFFKWHILKPARPFVGIHNYSSTLVEPKFWNAMWNSTRYAIVSVPLGIIVALLVAVLVNQKLKGITVFRTIFYTPSITSGVATAMLWIYIYLPEHGLINSMLSALGKNNKTDFLNDPAWAMWALVFMSVWTGLGPRMVLFLAGIVGIPQTLYEAAELDGASMLRQFWSVTLPMLAPTTLFVLLTSTISAFQVFTPVYMMTKGGPLDTTDVIGYHIYWEAWSKFNVGMASAQTFLLLIVIAAIAAFQYRIMKNQLEGYSVA
ncbi:MAG: sugar ABC transporter permease [Armatimonadetes bacterium]|nr:sugar ABC transporter permease [Armatimonadota bacterium]